ncbi:MAG TPA: beta-ketoacyl-ACP synthase II [Candidatus Handelsmanbacteria bacterium]|nr:beta-ketoacyl-ACP synthase II [Candidatus Handelsmanbacteria bacterium]
MTRNVQSGIRRSPIIGSFCLPHYLNESLTSSHKEIMRLVLSSESSVVWLALSCSDSNSVSGGPSACASAAHAIGEAARKIQYDEADVMVTGGAEASVTALSIAGFAASRALAQRNDSPEEASRPFDADRNGFVLGEGAGAFILEEFEHARTRRATIFAEFLGLGFTADAYHITDMPPGTEGAVRAMKIALRDAGLQPEQVNHVNAHGTSTVMGDSNETSALKTAFGDHAGRLAVSPTKSMTGHLLGAAGAIEGIACVLALHHGVLPPTINYETPDAACDLDYVPNSARETTIDVALNNSFGFGGHNAALLFGRAA